METWSAFFFGPGGSCQAIIGFAGAALKNEAAIRITSVEFRNYKAFKHYSVAVQPMNIPVGPNNCGKSTIVGAFRLLASSLRRARGRQPQYLIGPNALRYYGYNLAEENLPVSIENVHTDYADTDTQIIFRLSNSNLLRLYFPKTVESRYYWNQLAKTLEQQAHSERRIRLLSLLLLSSVLSSTRKISCSRKPLSVV